MTNKTIQTVELNSTQTSCFINVNDRKFDLRLHLTAVNDLKCYSSSMGQNCSTKAIFSNLFIDTLPGLNQERNSAVAVSAYSFFSSILCSIVMNFIIYGSN